MSKLNSRLVWLCALNLKAAYIFLILKITLQNVTDKVTAIGKGFGSKDLGARNMYVRELLHSHNKELPQDIFISQKQRYEETVENKKCDKEKNNSTKEITLYTY